MLIHIPFFYLCPLKTTQTYHSNGKLLLTGEYLVLQGAQALAVPAQFGQSLQISPIKQNLLQWESYTNRGSVWFAKDFALPLRTNRNSTDSIEILLLKILQQAQNQNPNFLKDNQGYKVQTQLEFPNDWGLGSSSTLLNNIAQWAQIDAFTLLENTMGGSGYDIACAQNNSPIIYQKTATKRLIQSIAFLPDFKEQLYFVHRNQKQKSAAEITRFNTLNKDFSVEIQAVSEITQLLIKSTALDDFEKLLLEHEKIISHVIQKQPVQELLFKDYFGQIKSLGAWGGDFILATGNEDTPTYFQKKGYNTVLLYEQMILKE